ncbi:MAG: UDP-N-acetylmuramoyl-L-alanyl-D-glutamate--2,6-diaminopimelate ligase [Dysgonamonadaceae bacterium]|jgi:UDP-N-acetylmuramoyl-L-alanyl-D-glutamate--2,6-diaminopimelate ligase|nr:UDP-N-acetylmuramoyl-L-alanyl-D-glutamate--2,6-diaminopimelate ligase [Dysgonamonadaceae bacterium]
MNLETLLYGTAFSGITGNLDKSITGIHFDSRKIKKGNLFVAVRGTQSDGHAYINQAIENGAIAVVCETLPATIQADVTYIQVKDSADVLGHLASAWNNHPSGKLILTGVTGTNGKTTVATLLYQLFKKMGYKTGLLSTVCNYIGDEAIPATHTTPDALELNRLLAQMSAKGCQYVFMEISSHAIVQRRISGLQFNGGIFTNLTHDHLDYHETFEAYRDAKKAFFDALPFDAFALTNIDDKNGSFMLQNSKAHKVTYAFKTDANFKGKILETHFDGTLMTIDSKEISTQFVGRFNAYNLLAVYAAAVVLDEEPENILIALSTLQPVAGRFQTFRSPGGYTAIVDYAHTPDALTNVLNAIHEVIEGTGEILTVVGCGGNRDKRKRPIMAKEAVRLSNRVILTSDNPRFENPDDIIQDMVNGLTAEEKKKTVCITDRREAIRTACLLAQSGDVILIAGKGHEDYQEVEGVKRHFDDREIVRESYELRTKN